MTTHGRVGNEAGFSLIELLVASLLVLLVVGGVLTMLVSVEEVDADTQRLLDGQQMVRASLERMQRDLQAAGVGLVWLLPPMPFIVPQAGGGLEIRNNADGVLQLLSDDMASPAGFLRVADATGFEAGQMVAVYDATGSLDLVTLTGVNQGSGRLFHGGVSKSYTVADATAVALVRRVVYRLQGGALVREEDGGPAQPIATGAQALDFTYFDNDTPAQVFNPTTAAEQLRVRAIGVRLEVAVPGERLAGAPRPPLEYDVRVTPRAIALAAG